MTPLAESVLSALVWHPRGLTIEALTTALGERERRNVEQAICDLRRAGEPIVSGAHGVRLAVDPAEVVACADALRRRRLEIALTERALRLTARRMPPQLELRLGGGTAA